MPKEPTVTISKLKLSSVYHNKSLHSKIDIPLGFLLQAYETTILTTNGEPTVLIGSLYFCEPNKLCFAIFGQPCNLLQFIEVVFITGNN